MRPSFSPWCAGSTGGSNGQFQVREFRVQPLEVGALAVNGGPLARDHRSQVHIHLAPFQAQPSEPARINRREAQPPQRNDEAQPRQLRGAVFAVAVGPARRGRQNAHLLVEADRRRGDPGAPGQLGYLHARTLHLQAT